MAEINRAEDGLTPDEEEFLEPGEPISRLSSEGESINEEAKLVPEPEEKEPFDYEKRKAEIEALYKDRMERVPEDPEDPEEKWGYNFAIKEIYADKKDLKDNGMNRYLKTLLVARKKMKKWEQRPTEQERISLNFSNEENLALELDRKKVQIDREKSAAIKELEEERNIDRQRRISEI